MTQPRTTSEMPVILRRSQSQEVMMPNRDAEKNVYFTYVCLINDISPLDSRARLKNWNQLHVVSDGPEQKDLKEHEEIQVGRSRAHHHLDLKEDANKLQQEAGNKPTSSECEANEEDDSDLDFNNFIGFDNPNVLNLTRMKWLTDGSYGHTDASSPSLSISSSDSTLSQNSVIDNLGNTDRHLSTILSIDKEHNLFGLAAVATAGIAKTPNANSLAQKEKAVFHQTTIVQVCCDPSECDGGCCQFKSKTDLPCSLKCNSCRSCSNCCDPCGACGPYGPPCFPPSCVTCKSCCTLCPQPPCKFGRAGLELLKIRDDYEVNEVELTPRSSCVTQLPLAARECHHRPRCQPPSPCFPYLTQCYWPARPSAPCADPRKCFHVPPCLPPRRPVSQKDPNTKCPPGGKCTDVREKLPCGGGNPSKISECVNPECPGKIPGYKEALLAKFSKQLRKC